MRAVVQRIKKGSVSIDQKITGSIEYGLLVYLGVEDGDTEKRCSLHGGKNLQSKNFRR